MKNTNKTNRNTVLIVALLIANLIATAVLAVFIFAPRAANAPGDTLLDFTQNVNDRYTLYIGTNDKDTNEQIIPTDEALEIVNGICAKYVQGYTASVAVGGWVSDSGVLVEENTLVYIFVGANQQQLVLLMDEVCMALNQSAILVEYSNISNTYYYAS